MDEITEMDKMCEMHDMFVQNNLYERININWIFILHKTKHMYDIKLNLNQELISKAKIFKYSLLFKKSYKKISLFLYFLNNFYIQSLFY